MKLKATLFVEIVNEDGNHSKFSLPLTMRGERKPAVWTEYIPRTDINRLKGASIFLNAREDDILKSAKVFFVTLSRADRREIREEVKNEGLFTTIVYEEVHYGCDITAEIFFEKE